ncbi:MAG: hypothetical protein PUH67_01925 [bacterium]|nr:hypothetical protein [bacterium]MDY4979798.1 hypothetical protein [Candidatus Onthovivens sp.]
MKKNLKRNKVLLTSLLGLAVVASSTAAFSTWIFGYIHKTEENQLTVKVDTTTNKSVVLTAKANNPVIKVGENAKVEGQTYVNVDVYESALQITLDTFKVTFSEATIKPTKINFELKEADFNKVNVASANDYFGRPTGDYTYIVLAQESITLAESNYTVEANDANGNNVWSINDNIVEFGWGTFFTYAPAGQTTPAPTKPSEFYNQNIEKKGEAEKLTAIKNGQTELDNMKKALHDGGKEFTLTITVETVDVTPIV